MRIYLREEPEVVAGAEDAYADAIERLVFPIIAESTVMTMRPVGVFRVDATYGRWPHFVLLWSYEEGFADYARGRTAASADVETTGQLTRDPRMIDYVANAGQWRQSSMEKLLVPTPPSPLPPPAPARTATSRIFLDQSILVRPGEAQDFLGSLEERRSFGAEGVPLHLELCARVAGRPHEFHVLWSLGSWDDWTTLQELRRADDHRPGTFGLPAAVTDVQEQTLIPFPFSPLGGTE